MARDLTKHSINSYSPTQPTDRLFVPCASALEPHRAERDRRRGSVADQKVRRQRIVGAQQGLARIEAATTVGVDKNGPTLAEFVAGRWGGRRDHDRSAAACVLAARQREVGDEFVLGCVPTIGP